LEQSCANISALLKAIADVCMLTYEDDAADGPPHRGKKVRGTALIGDQAVPALLDALLFIK